MPDLGSLYSQFQEKGFVVLAISDEEAGKVAPFVRQQNVKYPVLLDTGGRVSELFVVEGIPKGFVYDRDGKLATRLLGAAHLPALEPSSPATRRAASISSRSNPGKTTDARLAVSKRLEFRLRSATEMLLRGIATAESPSHQPNAREA